MQVLCLGEVLVDMLGQQTSAPEKNSKKIFEPFAGGAPANVAVAVAKLGGRSALVSKVGKDSFGKMLLNTLTDFGVDTHFIKSDNGKTALAFVDLDEHGERTFDFYVENAAHKNITEDDVRHLPLNDNTIVHLCSGSFSTDSLTQSTQLLIQNATSDKALLCMDINFRPGFWSEPGCAPAAIDAAARSMHVIKASQEELDELFDDPCDIIKTWLESGVQLVLISNGAMPVHYYTPTLAGEFDVPATQVSDTTAAGDAFIGGVLYQLARQLKTSDGLNRFLSDEQNVLTLLDFATRCGAITVSRFGAFDALPDQEDMFASS
ncbi:carbohydrate kinase family protein [Salinimonas chungwhensis]|uniref:carbohydrate kinase family protein n=1 Tax=Salinimonas chungwhensis TaxID=265425 RepID=UPI000369DD23|nr:carbohydrate kinase [Salinimonas chungwhensis]